MEAQKSGGGLCRKEVYIDFINILYYILRTILYRYINV